MEWKADQYASLFMKVNSKFWGCLSRWCVPASPAFWHWEEYLDSIGITRSATLWQELVNDPEVHIEILWSSTFGFLAGHDQDSVFLTNPAYSERYANFDFNSIKSISVAGSLRLVAFPGFTDLSASRILIVPKETAEKILVLGL